MSARIYTTRRLKSASGADIKSTTGKYIRVRVHKETRQVSKVKPELWTEAANTAYAQRYPNDIDVKKPRKNKVKTASPAPEVPLLLPRFFKINIVWIALSICCIRLLCPY